MPANIQQLNEAIRALGRGLASSARSIQAAQAEAVQLLHAAARDQDLVRDRIQVAVAVDPSLRCAVPLKESIAAGFPIPTRAESLQLLAVDGSQVVPDRHEELLFALVNVGSVLMVPDSGLVPETDVETTLLFGDELLTSAGRVITEGDLSLRRDIAERQGLLKSASARTAWIGLLDGPLELWGAKDVSEPRAFEMALRGYLDDLRVLRSRGCFLAGYVDKPAADLVIKMLELSAPVDGAAPARPPHQVLRGVTDRWLFSQVLQPRARSAVFALQSSSRARYQDDLAIHFFYLNVGSERNPVLARVEFPAWVAGDPNGLDALHRGLIEQCSFLAARPYPYVLHRAHETARITSQEREQIKLRLLLEMRNQGMEPESASSKSSAKRVSSS